MSNRMPRRAVSHTIVCPAALAALLALAQTGSAQWSWYPFRAAKSTADARAQIRRVKPREESRISLIGGQPMRAKVHEYHDQTSPPNQRSFHVFGKRLLPAKFRFGRESAESNLENPPAPPDSQPSNSARFTAGLPAKQPADQRSWWQRIFSVHRKTITRPIGVR